MLFFPVFDSEPSDVHLSDAEIVAYNNNNMLIYLIWKQLTLCFMFDIEFLQERPSHPRDRLKRGQKQKDVEIKLLRKVPQHPRYRLKRKTKNRKSIQNVFDKFEDERLSQKAKSGEAEFVKKVPQHLRDRLARRTKNRDEAKFVKRVPQHPCDRFKKNYEEKKYAKRVRCI